MPTPTVPSPWPWITAVLSVALMAFGIAWEWILDPLRPGGSWMVLKVLPLAFITLGLAQGRLRTFRWASLVVWLYVGEALVRVMGLSSAERSLAAISLVLSLLLAAAVLMGAHRTIQAIKSLAAADQAGRASASDRSRGNKVL